MNLFLAPHNDDETLFGAFTLLRHRPHVVVVLRSQVQEDRGYGITAAQREAETGAAMALLGCTWEQWPYLDTDPDWAAIEARLRQMDVERVFAPAVERDGGHPQHDRLGELAQSVFGERLTAYLTYTTRGKSTNSTSVPHAPGWMATKLRALACYVSQAAHPSCAPHFQRSQAEFYA